MTHTLQLDFSSDLPLVLQITRLIEAQLNDRSIRPGARLPSIRQFAERYGVSRSTVVEAYDRLVASGLVESRRGSGFYIREPAASPQKPAAIAPPATLNVTWLIRSLFRSHPPHKMPGSGFLPSEWHAPELLAGALRAVSRDASSLLQYGSPQGYLPLRQQLQKKLAELEIAVAPDQLLTTVGVTQGLGLVASVLLKPGDTVFVDEPSWFLMFGSFATLGVRVVGVPRLLDGPDIQKLEELALLHKPKLFIINSILHNPSSGSLSSAKAFQVLRLAETYDFYVVEDDVYGDLHQRGLAGARICALDQLKRSIYLGGFSKTLSGSLRVGFVACALELAEKLADEKMLRTLTSSEIGERAVYQVLVEGQFRKQLDRLRSKLDTARVRVLRQLERIGLSVAAPAEGMFLWVDIGKDTLALTQAGLEQGYLFAPGSLFSPEQAPSTWTRFNVACMTEPGVFRFLEEELAM
jgi:DNA-binding transcriptional MocR family regulator